MDRKEFDSVYDNPMSAASKVASSIDFDLDKLLEEESQKKKHVSIVRSSCKVPNKCDSVLNTRKQENSTLSNETPKWLLQGKKELENDRILSELLDETKSEDLPSTGSKPTAAQIVAIPENKDDETDPLKGLMDELSMDIVSTMKTSETLFTSEFSDSETELEEIPDEESKSSDGEICDLPIELQKCGKCREVIGKSESCKSEKYYYHSDHFCCEKCGESLISKEYFQLKRKIYCESDYRESFLEKCVECGELIEDQVLDVMDGLYHIDCFKCSTCGEVIGQNEFNVVKRLPVCMDCFAENHAKMCDKCKTPILYGQIGAFKLLFHPECFTCKECNMELKNGEYHVKDDNLYCVNHFMSNKKTTCHACRKPIIGASLRVGEYTFHKEHFKCTYCTCLLEGKEFRMLNSSPYCDKCFSTFY